MKKLKGLFSITPIWSNPIGWARKVGQSRAKVILWALIHITFVVFSFWSIYFLTGKIQSDNFSNQATIDQLRMMAMVPAVATMILIGAFYPALYLYAIYRLLREIDKSDKPTDR